MCVCVCGVCVCVCVCVNVCMCGGDRVMQPPRSDPWSLG